MRYLLDTHIFLFLIDGNNSLPKKTIDIVNDPIAEKNISIASIWEISIKLSLGKLKIKHSISDIYQLLNKYEVKILNPKKEVFEILSSLKLIHRDPFDRMIISQAIADDLTMITDDQYIRNYPNLKLF